MIRLDISEYIDPLDRPAYPLRDETLWDSFEDAILYAEAYTGAPFAEWERVGEFDWDAQFFFVSIRDVPVNN